jgi:hypothetical protein
MTVRLQNLYAKPASMRDGGNRELIEWLSNQPDVMSQTLARKVKSVAELHLLSSTASAIDAFLAK